MKRVCIGIVFMVNALAGITQGQIENFGEFYQPEKISRYEGVFSVYCKEEKIYLEIPEKLLGREMLLTAQVNRGAMMLARPLPALGVFHFMLGEKGNLYLQKGKYTERITDRKNPLARILANSNNQPVNEVFEIVAVNPENQGYIIDITKALKNGKGWMDIKLENLRNAGSDMALKQVEMTKDGAAFAFTKSFFHSYPLQAAGIKGQEGRISVEIGCMLRILPEQPLSLKYAAASPGYEVIRFTEYSKNPYGVSKDSVIQRWRVEVPRDEQAAYRKGKKIRPAEPIVFYIDADCPKVWRPWIKKAVLDWNRAFEEAGFVDVLQVHIAEKSENTVKYRALISYDLSIPLLAGEKAVHPETGEILACRVNIGHGVWGKQRERYLLQCGAVDQRIITDFDNVEVAGEILCSMVTREIGCMLGLKYNAAVDTPYSTDRIRSGECPFTASVMSENTYNYIVQPGDRGSKKGFIAGVGEYDGLIIAGGYGERACLHKVGMVRKGKMLNGSGQEVVKDKIRAAEYGIRNLNAVYNQLEQQTKTGKSVNEKDDWLEHIHQVGKELYEEYLLKVANCIGEGAESEVVAFLEQYLFAPAVKWPSFAVLPDMNENLTENERLACCKNAIKKMCSPGLGKKLLQKDSGYALHELYADLHRLVFSDFAGKTDLSAFDLNLQSYYVKILLEYAVEEKAADCNNDYQACLYFELQNLRDYFRRLAEETPGTLSGRFYKVCQKKIEKQIIF